MADEGRLSRIKGATIDWPSWAYAGLTADDVRWLLAKLEAAESALQAATEERDALTKKAEGHYDELWDAIRERNEAESRAVAAESALQAATEERDAAGQGYDELMAVSVTKTRELTEARAALRRVRELHQPLRSRDEHGSDERFTYCLECGIGTLWPCRTVAALDVAGSSHQYNWVQIGEKR